ncbi:copper-translocating P-type ATPase [Roseobacter cerasinus]|uniref:Copper-translocating P-type ATPase n=1 Tax=Roseobacter cerasinus TaxID=2602289 RepID=A0A640VP25_9RHOB|nr:heavy metal translocating P-type ATPase [Roseobacter cerasinus]GFE49394.1 copper-translocating P-type ATPase [Roseobacter cerasinus]
MRDAQTITLTVGNMSCASCVGRVDRALAAVPGVRGVVVNLATEEATIEVDDTGPTAEALAQTATDAGYPAQILQTRSPDAAHDRKTEEAQALARRTWLAGLLAMPVFVLEMGSHMVPAFHHFVMQTIGMQQSWWIQALLTTLILAGPGRAFYTKGIAALMHRAPDMNSLVAVGTFAAYGYSLCVLLAPGLLPAAAQAVYFEAAAVIVFFILLGRSLEARAKGRTGAAIRALLKLQPKTAQVLRDGNAQTVAVEQIVPGDIVLLRPGERVPVDAVVTEGSSHLDESMITGEPIPVEKHAGDPVTGGTINGPGSLTLRATHVGTETVLAGIIRMVQDAQGAKLPIQALVDRVTLWFVPAVLGLAALTVMIWLAVGPAPVVSYALVAGVAVLIIACPCAMGLATPTSIMVATGRAAELGVLFRKGDALQALADVDVIAFDKTGTLTKGAPVLTSFEMLGGPERDTALALVAAVEARVEHPVANAIVDAAKADGLTLPDAQEVTALSGLGARGQVGGQRVLVGSEGLMAQHDIPLGDALAKADTRAAAGETVFFAAIDGQLAALICVADQIKSNAAEVVADLHAQGVRVAMITGDKQETAEAVARELGIDDVIARVLPEGKTAALETIRASGARVAFVGDGINDAPALATADVGIAIGSGTDIAIGAADVVLMSGDLRGVQTAMHASRAAMRNIRQNLFWAFAYNTALIPVAAGALYASFGLLLSPQLAAGAMALSSLFVLSNALRLRGLKRGTA